MLSQGLSAIARSSAVHQAVQQTAARAAAAVCMRSYTTNHKKVETVRRCIFSVPGYDTRKISKLPKLDIDSIVLDLEDAVPVNRKKESRDIVCKILNEVDFGRGEVGVRVNDARSALVQDDLKAVLQTKSIDAIVIPKVESPSDVKLVNDIIDHVAPDDVKDNIRLLLQIESANAILNLREIASASQRVDALIFASEDYCADVGIHRTRGAMELLFARSSVVTHAAAHNLQAIDMVCIDYHDKELLTLESREAHRMGFTGKQAVHPVQVPIIHKEFSPSTRVIERAQRIVDGYKAHQDAGIGAFDLDGVVIDLPVLKWAEKVIARAQVARATGSYPSEEEYHW
eukprot:comp11584_c0_seq1/m.6061 comp11584_c0_seq1/g.6061  ORF comp11584_c0_seq1/g.6061 comp11584_c0_seq1/m.6061 type:complete len:343 (-) comp11584_c0_seq1:393-1421(-)